MTLLNLCDLGVRIAGHDRPLLHGVNLSIEPGEAVGLVGESGSGKSLTTRAVMRLLATTTNVTGAVQFKDRDVYGMSQRELRAWRSSEVAMIFQDPRAHINPVHTVGNFLTEGTDGNYASRSDAADAACRMLKEVGIADGARRMNQRPHELSGGLLQRVMIAAALMHEPELLIADEPTTALDVTTQSEVMAIIDELRVRRGMALLFITHDLDLAAAVCDRMVVMYAGAIVERSRPDALVDRPAHPYSAGLLRCRPELGHPRPLAPIPGRPISGLEVGQGCAFADRCTAVMEICRTERPQLIGAADGAVACHLWRDGLLLHETEVLNV